VTSEVIKSAKPFTMGSRKKHIRRVVKFIAVGEIYSCWLN